MNIQTNRRALLGAIALAPIASAAIAVPALGAEGSGAFEAALETYYRLRDADRYDVEHGDLRAAYDLYKRRTEPFRVKYGEARFATGADRVRVNGYFQQQCHAETRHTEAFSEPRWDAFDALLDTPSPSPAALLLKLELAEDEGLNEEKTLDLVRRDLGHLAKGRRN